MESSEDPSSDRETRERPDVAEHKAYPLGRPRSVRGSLSGSDLCSLPAELSSFMVSTWFQFCFCLLELLGKSPYSVQKEWKYVIPCVLENRPIAVRMNRGIWRPVRVPPGFWTRPCVSVVKLLNFRIRVAILRNFYLNKSALRGKPLRDSDMRKLLNDKVPEETALKGSLQHANKKTFSKRLVIWAGHLT